MTETEKAWAAGFFDGEGSVIYHPKNKCISATIGQSTDTEIPEVLLRFRKAVNVGSIGGPYKHTKPKWRNFCQYHCSAYLDVVRLFVLLGPYLSKIKLTQFESALSAYSSDPHVKRHKRNCPPEAHMEEHEATNFGAASSNLVRRSNIT